MKMLIWAGAIVVIGVILFYVFRKAIGADTTSIQKEMAYGPFIIRAEAISGKTYNINYGMVKQTNISYSIWFEGKPVVFPSALQTNTVESPCAC